MKPPIDSPSTAVDDRTPSPPWGYSRPCTYNRERQLHLVAEFHAHRIRPGRIAYRTGIDIAFIRQLLAGEVHKREFNALVNHYRKRRRQERLQDSCELKGSARFELEQRIEAEYQAPT